MPKFLYILVLTGMWVLNSYAQNPDIKRTWHWYFGAGAGLDFSSGTAVADTTGALHTYEGCSVMSDTAGNLLFYTDGDTVWNKKHQPMPNGTGLMGCGNYGSSAQAALIIPHPGNDNLFYIFTTDCWENLGIGGYRYSIVNMELNGGLGQVISKNHLLFGPSTEGIAATYSCSKDTIWIVTHEYNNNSYRIYKLTKYGIDTIPIKQNIGSIANFYIYMRFSPNGKYLVMSDYSDTTDILFFDKSKGLFTNVISLYSYGGDYGPVFSSDNSKLYIMNSGSYIFQYDLINIANIYQSKNIIAYNPDNSTFGAINNAPDKKMYISSIYNDSISYINYPNNYGISCDIQIRKFYLRKKSALGITDFIQDYFNENTDIGCDDVKLNNITIPNIFTPNNDNINDYFSIQISGYTHIEYYIYNRWGNLIGKGRKDLNAQIKTEEPVWDGKYKGEEVLAGVYFFLIKAIKQDGKEDIRKGYVHLIR